MTKSTYKGPNIAVSNRYVDDHTSKVTFRRDVDRLFLEYTNLRMYLYNTYRSNFTNYETQQELLSYINEQFVKLTKEYDIHGPVDFPGYIKTKLTLRVRQVFVNNHFRDKARESVPRDENFIENILEADTAVEGTSIDDYDFLNYVFRNVKLNDLETFIIDKWLGPPITNVQLIREAVEKFGYSKGEVTKEICELKEFIRGRVKAYRRD